AICRYRIPGPRRRPQDRRPGYPDRPPGAEKRGYDGSSRACPHCREAARFQRRQAKTVHNAVGVVRLSRAYYYCRHRRRGHCPWDTVRRLTASDLTPAAEELVSLAGALTRFAEAAEKVLPRLAGLRLAESTAERTTEAAGQRLRRRRAAGQTFGRAWDWP